MRVGIAEKIFKVRGHRSRTEWYNGSLGRGMHADGVASRLTCL